MNKYMPLIAVIIGGLLGFWLTNNYHALKEAERIVAQNEAERTQREYLSTLSRQYYESFQAVNNRKPTVITERVLVKGNCLPAGADAGVDDGENAGSSRLGERDDRSDQVELSQSVIDSLIKTIDSHERMYLQCVNKLNFFQEFHRKK